MMIWTRVVVEGMSIRGTDKERKDTEREGVLLGSDGVLGFGTVLEETVLSTDRCYSCREVDLGCLVGSIMFIVVGNLSRSPVHASVWSTRYTSQRKCPKRLSYANSSIRNSNTFSISLNTRSHYPSGLRVATR